MITSVSTNLLRSGIAPSFIVAAFGTVNESQKVVQALPEKLFGITCVQNRVGYLSKVASRYSSRPEMSTNAILEEETWDLPGTKRSSTNSTA
jgi:hypothetical protein